MKLYEFIVTYNDSKEVYKEYRYFKSLKDCRKYVESYGMEIVRIREAKNVYDTEILKAAKEELENRE